jgi:molecular chaperone GrpE
VDGDSGDADRRNHHSSLIIHNFLQMPDPSTDTSDVKANEVAEANEAAGVVDEAAAESAADRAGRSVEEELASVQEQLLRTAADFQNYRRRIEQQRVSESAYIRMSVIEPFLTILDDLERTLEAAGDSAGADSPGIPEGGNTFFNLREGVALVYRNFVDELKRMGVETIPSVGQRFDVSMHDALMQQPATDDTPPGTIVGEIQKGYRLGDRVLRHAKVIVSAATQ